VGGTSAEAEHRANERARDVDGDPRADRAGSGIDLGQGEEPRQVRVGEAAGPVDDPASDAVVCEVDGDVELHPADGPAADARNQVAQHVRQRLGIGCGRRRRAIDVEHRVEAREAAGLESGHRIGAPDHRDRFACQEQRVVLESGQDEQVLDRTEEPPGLGVDVGGELATHRGQQFLVAREHGGAGVDRRDRGPQLVRQHTHQGVRFGADGAECALRCRLCATTERLVAGVHAASVAH
jgi:hypothetical protein